MAGYVKMVRESVREGVRLLLDAAASTADGLRRVALVN